jgi:hypothetical protein
MPVVIGLTLIFSPQVYYGLKADPSYQESNLQFYSRFFNVHFAIDFPLFIEGTPPEELFRLSTMYFLIDLFVLTLLLLLTVSIIIGRKLMGSKSLVFGVEGIFQVGLKRAFVNQPGLSQFHARQPAISEQATQVLHVVPTVECSGLYGYAVVEYNWDC